MHKLKSLRIKSGLSEPYQKKNLDAMASAVLSHKPSSLEKTPIFGLRK